MKNRLSDLSQGKENNLNLIRMIAASSVLITHSFALVTGTGASEPLRQSLGLALLHKSTSRRPDPNPGRTHATAPTGTVCGRPI